MDYTVYRVEGQETMEDIAKKFDLPADVLIKDNGADKAFLGMRLLIRKHKGKIYYVGPFDTLDLVAEKFGISKSRLAELNDGIEEVFFGQIIYVPEK